MTQYRRRRRTQHLSCACRWVDLGVWFFAECECI